MDIKLAKIVVKVGAGQNVLFKIPHLEIKKGETVLIKGASGNGKTTLFPALFSIAG